VYVLLGLLQQELQEENGKCSFLSACSMYVPSRS
jgi:hypothetical protein